MGFNAAKLVYFKFLSIEKLLNYTFIRCKYISLLRHSIVYTADICTHATGFKRWDLFWAATIPQDNDNSNSSHVPFTEVMVNTEVFVRGHCQTHFVQPLPAHITVFTNSLSERASDENVQVKLLFLELVFIILGCPDADVDS